MKTLLRWLLATVLALSALGVSLLSIILILFFFNRPWQAEVLDAFLERSTGWQWDIEEVRLGWNRVEASQVFVLQGGDGFEMRQVDLNLRTRSLLRRNPVELHSGTLEGLMVDLSQMPAATLGMTPRELAALPEDTDASLAVQRMIQLSLERLQMSGIHLEAQSLRMAGIILLPAHRVIDFEAMVEYADSIAPEALAVSVYSARLR